MSQQSQRTDATEGDSQPNASDFPEQLPGNSIDLLGCGYLLPTIFTHISDSSRGVL